MTVDRKEIEHFAKDAARWWDAHGPFAPLHRLNHTRLSYLRAQIDAHYGCDHRDLTPYKTLSVLDIGCGGGLVCEPLARLGARVTGIDADKQAIMAAQDHARQSGLKINYQPQTTSDLLSPPSRNSAEFLPSPLARGEGQGGGYDIVLALEIIEHVTNPAQFIKEVTGLCKPGGLIIVSTLNRTIKSYALGIFAAEQVLRWVAPGTHHWKKFIRPSELSRLLRQAGATPQNVQGMIYRPLSKEFVLARDTDVNYFMAAARV